jgi:hypothetical protein
MLTYLLVLAVGYVAGTVRAASSAPAPPSFLLPCLCSPSGARGDPDRWRSSR